MSRQMTQRQESAVRRISASGGREMISPDLARQLVRRGVVVLTGRKYQRVEWNRPVKGTTLWEVELRK